MAIPNIFIEVTLLGASSASMLGLEHVWRVIRVPIASDADPSTDRCQLLMSDGVTLIDLIDTYDSLRAQLLPPGV